MGLLLFIVGCVVVVVASVAYAAWQNQQRAESELGELLRKLADDPMNASPHLQLLAAMNQTHFQGLPTATSGKVYATSLDILEQHPESRPARAVGRC